MKYLGLMILALLCAWSAALADPPATRVHRPLVNGGRPPTLSDFIDLAQPVDQSRGRYFSAADSTRYLAVSPSFATQYQRYVSQPYGRPSYCGDGYGYCGWYGYSTCGWGFGGWPSYPALNYAVW